MRLPVCPELPLLQRLLIVSPSKQKVCWLHFHSTCVHHYVLCHFKAVPHWRQAASFCIESRVVIGPSKSLDTPLPAVAVAGVRGGEADYNPQLSGEGGWNSDPPGTGPHDPPSLGLHQQAASVRFFLTKVGKLPCSCEVALYRCCPCGWQPARQLA